MVSPLSGDPSGTRTPDPLLKRQLLYLLSYQVLWQGRRDSNPLYRSQSPVCYRYTTSLYGCRHPQNKKMGWVMGLEPTTPGTTIRCSNQLSYTHHICVLNWYARRDSNPRPTA